MTTESDMPVRRTPAGTAKDRKRHTGAGTVKRSTGKKRGPVVPGVQPGCILVGVQGSCPGWDGLLDRFPMIDSVQREDFPEHGASFVYLAHLYRTRDRAEESARVQQEFGDFFRTIGYEYRSSGNYKSRWFEGIGVRLG